MIFGDEYFLLECATKICKVSQGYRGTHFSPAFWGRDADVVLLGCCFLRHCLWISETGNGLLLKRLKHLNLSRICWKFIDICIHLGICFCWPWTSHEGGVHWDVWHMVGFKTWEIIEVGWRLSFAGGFTGDLSLQRGEDRRRRPAWTVLWHISVKDHRTDSETARSHAQQRERRQGAYSLKCRKLPLFPTMPWIQSFSASEAFANIPAWWEVDAEQFQC